MPLAEEPAQQDERASCASWMIAWVLGPVITWVIDVVQALNAGVPSRGLFGSVEAASMGLLSAGGVYFAVYLGIRSLLEGPRLILEQLSGAAVRISPMWTGLLALLVIFYLDL
ncbi:MAG TPA: hypothetical protein PLU39_02385 [Armatimonadota bacterium]|mgnify:FL=1|jgi:hypothetical protein|nr:hypothetical protein [Armatimonadota bacterium]HOM81217.1 hypothetical protein [Armatimonadota bacterium]HOQ29966.1 hypothetical protein [Armatimonadota bacterium]HPO74083.1 hypothetical protein [Armatimonadota bacterium]HPT96695.1 hypothetical protein [Armatimonadota bacterium]